MELYPADVWRHLSLCFPQRNGHQADVLCVAHCPPSLLATSSWNGEIIVWNLVSGCVHSRLVSPPPPEHQHVEGDIGASKRMMMKSPVLRISCDHVLFLSHRPGCERPEPPLPQELQVAAVVFGCSSAVVWNHRSVFQAALMTLCNPPQSLTARCQRRAFCFQRLYKCLEHPRRREVCEQLQSCETFKYSSFSHLWI